MILVEILLMLPWLAVCLGLIALAIYFKKKDQEFKTKGIKTIFKVKDVFIDEIHHETGKVTKELVTIFEFVVNGKIEEIELPTRKEYEIGNEIEGYYLPDSKYDKVSTKEFGFYKHKYAEAILIGFAIVLMVPVVIPMLIELFTK